MSGEPPLPEPGTGRSRGRARGRAQPSPAASLEESLQQTMRISVPPLQLQSNDGNGSGNGNGDNGHGNGNGNNGNGVAIRGRGGYRGQAELDTRPEDIERLHGNTGDEIRIFGNYFHLKTPTNAVVQNFHVKYTPNVESPQMRRQMLYSIENLFDKPFIFDGMSEIKSLSVEREDRERTVTNPADGSNVNILIRHTGEIPWGSAEMMRMYNIQMRKNLRYIGYVLMGNNYYDLKSQHTIAGHNIQLLPGVITAIAQHDEGILMVVDSSTKFIRTETVLQVLSQMRSRYTTNWMDEAKKEICGAIVMTKYNNRTYKVDDLVTGADKTPATATFIKDGREMNLIEYYKQSYGITITQPNQPLIECLPSLRDRRAGRIGKLLLVPELCSMTGLTDQMRSDFQLMRKVGDVSRLKPTDRVANLKKFMTSVTKHEKVVKDMEQWGLEFDSELVEIHGRVLPEERIVMGRDAQQSATNYVQKTGDFGKEIRSKPLFSAVNLTKWMIIVTKRDHNLVSDFGANMRRVCSPMGINLSQPSIEVLTDDRTSSFVSMCQSLDRPYEMVVVIVPNNNKDRYDAIKKTCYCEHPMPSQVIVSRTLSKKQMLMSVCTKIAIQMASKLGGEPWALRIPPKDLMVVGYDTYHDSSTRGQSVGGFVCSMNQTLTSWYSRVAYHSNREEMSANFASNLKEGIKSYFEKNKTLPKRVIVYRDGVGEGMIPHVFDYELKQILSALEAINKADPPALAFIIVSKRVNARFFTQPDGQTYDNPIPGTIVDKMVTRKMRYDFYLISQSVRQGTVTPTLYNIIFDKTKFKAEHHQQLAYKLTHLYFNWQGTIGVPAPCQYAHKLAYLTGTSLHRQPHQSLCHQLFYL